jgi:hypothetical protein
MVGPSLFFGSQNISGTENMASFDTEISLNNISKFLAINEYTIFILKTAQLRPRCMRIGC